MLSRNLPATQKSLVVPPEPLEVVLAAEGDSMLAVAVPPLDELAEIDALRASNVSVSAGLSESLRRRAVAFGDELDRALGQFDQFSNSPTFLSRLATLADAAGDRTRAIDYIERARLLTSDSFFAHKHVDYLAGLGRHDDAERVINSLDVENDVFATLKLAACHVLRGDHSAARALVNRAAATEPDDFAVRLFDGGLRLLSNEYRQAIHSFRVAADNRPTSAVVFSNIAVAYLKLGKPKQAMQSLKRAVALSPLNVKAISLLADVAFQLRCDSDAIPSLRYVLQFEQLEPSAWARLARACFQIGDFDATLEALKREASVRESTGAFNNLGVTHARRGDSTRALQWFRRALEVSGDRRDRSYFLAARNVAQALSAGGAYREVLTFCARTLDGDTNNLCLSDDTLSDLYVFKMIALRMTDQLDLATATAESLVVEQRTATALRVWTLNSLIGFAALSEPTAPRTLALVKMWSEWVLALPPTYAGRRSMAINNIAFALAEAGDLVGAERFVALISSLVGREPYPTATLGLLSMRKGHFERGVRQYRDAIALAASYNDKARIRQKLALETARHEIGANPQKALELFQSVVATKDGEPALVAQARRELLRLRGPDPI